MISETPRQFSDEAIRRFLLGSLNSTEQSAFEHLLFTDEGMEERVRLAELELSDDFAANRLSSVERNLFRQRFVLTADRQRQLEVSKALQINFTTATVSSPVPFWQRVANNFDIRRHAWKYAFAALTLVLLVLTAALLVKRENSRLAGEPGKPPRVAPRPSATSNPQPAHHPPNAGSPAHAETPPALPLHDGLTTSVVLDSATPIESAPTISTSGDVITVQLKLGQPLAESYDLNVMTSAGESVFSSYSLRRENEIVAFDLPTSSLKPGDFQIGLTRVEVDSKQGAGIYYFRIR